MSRNVAKKLQNYCHCYQSFIAENNVNLSESQSQYLPTLARTTNVPSGARTRMIQNNQYHHTELSHAPKGIYIWNKNKILLFLSLLIIFLTYKLITSIIYLHCIPICQHIVEQLIFFIGSSLLVEVHTDKFLFYQGEILWYLLLEDEESGKKLPVNALFSETILNILRNYKKKSMSFVSCMDTKISFVYMMFFVLTMNYS